MLRNVVSYRDIAPTYIDAQTPALPVSDAPFKMPPPVVERLRGLQLAYQSGLDTYLMGQGYAEGGCAVDLKRGMVYPPGTYPTQGQEQQ